MNSNNAKDSLGASQSQYTVADVLRDLKGRNDISRGRFMHLACRVKLVCKLLGNPPAKIPLNIPTLRKQIASIDLSKTGMAPHSLGKLLWAFRDVIENSPLLDPKRTRRSNELSPEWRAVLAEAWTRSVKTSLSRFAYYCSRHGIPPRKVTNAIFDDFGIYWHRTRLLQNQFQHHRKLARLWDQLVVRSPSLNLKPLMVSISSRRGKFIPLDQFPLALGAEVDRFLTASQDTSLFNSYTSTRPIGAATAVIARRRIIRAADALVRAGEPIANITSLAKLTSLESVRKILQICNNEKNRKPNFDNWYLAQFLRHIAKQWVGQSVGDLKKLAKLHKEKLPNPVGSMGRTYANRLEQFEDSAALRRLLEVPASLWNQVRCEKRLTGHSLARAQGALALDIMLHVAPRLEPLSALEFGRHIRLPPTGTGSICFGARETTCRRPLEFTLPEEVARRLIEYRDKLFPAISGKHPKHLFEHKDGRLKKKYQVRYLIQQYAWRHAGVRVSPQLFRSLAGALIIKQGGSLEEVADALGCKSIQGLLCQHDSMFDDRVTGEYCTGLNAGNVSGGEIGSAI